MANCEGLCFSPSNQKVHDSNEILSHLSEKSGRVAVLPALFDAASVLGQELLFAGFPFIASTESALQKMIVAQDLDQVLVKPTAEALGAKFTSLIGQQGILFLFLTPSYHCPTSQLQVHRGKCMACTSHHSLKRQNLHLRKEVRRIKREATCVYRSCSPQPRLSP